MDACQCPSSEHSYASQPTHLRSNTRVSIRVSFSRNYGDVSSDKDSDDRYVPTCSSTGLYSMALQNTLHRTLSRAQTLVSPTLTHLSRRIQNSTPCELGRCHEQRRAHAEPHGHVAADFLERHRRARLRESAPSQRAARARYRNASSSSSERERERRAFSKAAATSARDCPLRDAALSCPARGSEKRDGDELGPRVNRRADGAPERVPAPVVEPPTERGPPLLQKIPRRTYSSDPNTHGSPRRLRVDSTSLKGVSNKLPLSRARVPRGRAARS